MSDELSDIIDQVARGPARVGVDGVNVDFQDLDKLRRYQESLAAQTAASRNHGGLTCRKLEPPRAG